MFGDSFNFVEPLSQIEMFKIIGRCEEKSYEIVDFEFDNYKALEKDKINLNDMWHNPYYFIGFAITHCEELECVDIRTHYGTFSVSSSYIYTKASFENTKRFVEEMSEGTKMKLERWR